MHESLGYSVIFNIVIVFVVIIFVFIGSVLVYFKSNKVSNVIADSIEKYSGYNKLSIEEINKNMSNLGYNKMKIKCENLSEDDKCKVEEGNAQLLNDGSDGYCVYFCQTAKVVEKQNESGNIVKTKVYYYYYKIKTNMMFKIPIINDILPLPIWSTTNVMYDFDENLK